MTITLRMIHDFCEQIFKKGARVRKIRLSRKQLEILGIIFSDTYPFEYVVFYSAYGPVKLELCTFGDVKYKDL